MPRPRKCRHVCCMPERDLFGPINMHIKEDNFIIMTVDEYETIRLIDYEDFNQEECALQMNVARTTVQRIYNDARKKISQSLVNGKILKIEGGDYKICDGSEKACRCNGCLKHKVNGIKKTKKESVGK